MGVRFDDGSADSFFTNMLREDYRPGVIDTLNNTNWLWGYLGRPDFHVEGKHWVHGIHTGRSAGHGAIGPTGALPDPDSQKYGRWRGPMRHHYGRIQFGTVVQEASASAVASFMQALDGEIRGLTEDMTREQNRFLQNDGSGRLGECNNAGEELLELTVRLPQINESPGTMTGMDATNWFRVGQRLLILASGTGNPTSASTIRGATTVTGITSATTLAVTTLGAIGIVVGDWIVINSSASNTTDDISSGYRREPMGLSGILSDANPAAYDTEDAYETAFNTDSFQNIDRGPAGNDFADANVLDGGGVSRPPHEMLIQTALTRARKTNNSNVDVMYSSLEQIDAFGALLLADRRYMNTMRLSGGWNAVDFAGIPWMGDRDAYPNRISFLDTQHLPIYELQGYDWEERDGLFKRLPDHDMFQSMFRGRWNLVCTIPNKQTILTELTEEITT
jgi:hypothetical protein